MATGTAYMFFSSHGDNSDKLSDSYILIIGSLSKLDAQEYGRAALETNCGTYPRHRTQSSVSQNLLKVNV